MPPAELIERVLPILGFLVCVTVIAELADRIGVFGFLAHYAARLARGSVVRLWLLVVLLATLATAVLSLDTTAVLLTPVVLALAQRLQLDRRMFAFTTVWLANTASLFLPVSNLTNLLALDPLEQLGVPANALGFLGLTWPAAVTSWLVTVIVLALLFRGSLRGRYDLGDRPEIQHRRLLVLGILVCAALGPALLAGVEVLVAAASGAAVLLAAVLIIDRSLIDRRLLPWKLVLGVFVLFVLVQLALEAGLGTVLAELGGQGEGWSALLRVAGLGALAANVVNNLPSYLALEVVGDTPHRMAALLVGVNAGPMITPWASLATLLWAGRCRSAGVSVDWKRFALLGLVLVVPLIVASTLALWLVGADD